MSASVIMFYFPFNKTMTGGPRTLLTLIELIDRTKFTPLVVTQKHSPLVEELIQRNVEVLVHPLPEVLTPEDKQVLNYGLKKKLKSFISLIQYNKKLIKLLKQRNIQLIWARNVKGVLFVGFAALFSRITLIWDIGLGDKFEGFVKILHFIALNLSDLVVTQGKSQHQIMFGKTLTRLYQRKLCYVLPGISQDRVKTLSKLTVSANSNDFTVLSIGTIGPRKNQKLLTIAVKDLINKYPFIQILYVGPIVDEAYYKELQSYVHKEKLLQNITFLGWRDDIPELMVSSHVLVVCSFNEGIPRVIHEAMHAQLPVIATKVGGIPDAIIHGETGYLIEPDDADHLTQFLKLLIENPNLAREIGTKAKAFAQENFTYQAYYKKYEQIFTRTIQKHNKG